MKKFKVIVAGSKSLTNYQLLATKLDKILSNYTSEQLEIVSGTAIGADTLGELYAKEHGIAIKRFPADWNKYGKSAGYLRNEQMAKYADACIVFWDCKSKGSKHMIDIAIKQGLPLRTIRFEN